MNLVFIVYLLGLVEKANVTLGVVTILSFSLVGLILLVKGIGARDISKDTQEAFTLWAKRFATTGVVTGLLFTLVPTKEISYAMLAAYGVEEIVTNDRVQELGGKSLDLLEKTLDEYLAEKKED